MRDFKINVIAAADENFGIGSNGDLPWTLKKEYAYFQRMTKVVEKVGTVNVIIMGSRTYFSNPKSQRPYKGRLNIVLSKKIIVNEPGVLTYSNWDDAISYCSFLHKENLIDKVWVIGGTSVYKVAMESPFCHRVYLTRIYAKFPCDTFFPGCALSKFELAKDHSVQDSIQEENGIQYRFEVYQPKRLAQLSTKH